MMATMMDILTPVESPKCCFRFSGRPVESSDPCCMALLYYWAFWTPYNPIECWFLLWACCWGFGSSVESSNPCRTTWIVLLSYIDSRKITLTSSIRSSLFCWVVCTPGESYWMLLFALVVLLRFWEFSRIIWPLLYDLNFADELVGLPYNPLDPCCFS